MITFSAGSVWAHIWEGDYTIVTGDDISVLLGYTVVSGNLKIVSSNRLKNLKQVVWVFRTGNRYL